MKVSKKMIVIVLITALVNLPVVALAAWSYSPVAFYGTSFFADAEAEANDGWVDALGYCECYTTTVLGSSEIKFWLRTGGTTGSHTPTFSKDYESFEYSANETDIYKARGFCWLYTADAEVVAES